MSTSFGRELSVNVAGKVFSSSLNKQSLRIAFVVEKDKTRFPNSVEVALYNLAESTRSKLEQEGAATVTISAGYEGSTSVIFSGALRKIESIKDGADWVTRLSGGDKEDEIASNHFAATFNKGTPLLTILKQIIKALGIGEGNLPLVGAELLLRTTSKATALSGPASDVLADFLRGVGWSYSIQDGAFLGLSNTTPPASPPVLLTPFTGLLGVPRLDQKGKLSAKALFDANVKPGSIVSLQSQSLTGAFVVSKSIHTGDTAEADWFVDFTGDPI